MTKVFLFGTLFGFVVTLLCVVVWLLKKDEKTKQKIAEKQAEIRTSERVGIAAEIKSAAQTLVDCPEASISLQLVADDILKGVPIQRGKALKKYIETAIFAYFSIKDMEEKNGDIQSSGLTH